MDLKSNEPLARLREQMRQDSLVKGIEGCQDQIKECREERMS